MSTLPKVQRPVFIACGDSITENGFLPEGWVQKIASYFFPLMKIDLINRGFAGYNTRWYCQQILPTIQVEFHLQNMVTICFGTNDSVLPDNESKYSYQYVPIDEYVENIETIINHFRGKAKIILMTPPIVDGEAYQKYKLNKSGESEPIRRTLENTRAYAEALHVFKRDPDVFFIDIFTDMEKYHFNMFSPKEKESHKKFLSDGIHLTSIGNDFIYHRLLFELAYLKIDWAETDPMLWWKNNSTKDSFASTLLI